MSYFDTDPRTRIRKLTTKLLAHPTAPILGWTKTVETLVAGGNTLNWIGYSAGITLLWVFADAIKEASEQLGESVQETVEEATDNT